MPEIEINLDKKENENGFFFGGEGGRDWYIQRYMNEFNEEPFK